MNTMNQLQKQYEQMKLKINYILTQLQQSIPTKELLNEINLLKNKVIILEEYNNDLKKAGFDPYELERQMSILLRAHAMKELAEEIGILNSSGNYTLTEFTLVGQELGLISKKTSYHIDELLTSGVLRFKTSRTLDGLLSYNYETDSMRYLITTTNDNSQVFEIKWKVTDTVIRLPIPKHEIIWKGNSDRLIMNTLLLKYSIFDKWARLSLAYTITNLEEKTVVTEFTPKIGVSISSLIKILVDLPPYSSATCTLVRNWKDYPHYMLDMYVEDYAFEEIFLLYRVYINNLTAMLGSETVASSYGQGALAALSNANNVLSSTIVNVSADYNFPDKFEKSCTILPTDVKCLEDFSTECIHASIETESAVYNSYLSSTSVNQVLSLFSDGTQFITSDVVTGPPANRIITLTNLDTDFPTMLNGTVKRTAMSVMKDIPFVVYCEIDAQQKFNRTLTPHIGYVYLDKVMEKSEIYGYYRGFLKETGSNTIVQGSPEFFVTTPPKRKDSTAYFMIGSYVTQPEVIKVILQISASHVIDYGESITFKARMSYSVMESNFKNVELEFTRKYVSSEDKTEKLVYEAQLTMFTHPVTYLFGYVSPLVREFDTLRPLYEWPKAKLDPFRDYDPGFALVYKKATETSWFYDPLYNAPYMYPVIIETMSESKPVERIVRVPLVPGRFVHPETGICDFQTLSPASAILLNYPKNMLEFVAICAPENVIVKGTHVKNILHPSQLWTRSAIAPTIGRPVTLSFSTPWGFRHQSYARVGYHGFTKKDSELSLHHYSAAYLLPCVIPIKITMLNFSLQELSLPIGIYSDRKLNEDILKLWNTADLLLEYTSSIKHLIDNIDLRIKHIDDSILKLSQAIQTVSTTLSRFIQLSSAKKKPTPFGVAGQVLSFLSSSVSVFFPIVGTAFGVFASIFSGIDQLNDNDVINGSMELTISTFTASLGLYKFSNRMKRKIGLRPLSKHQFPITDIYDPYYYIKTPSYTPFGYGEPPPPYEHPTSASTNKHQISGLYVRTTETPIDEKLNLTSVVYHPLQMRSFSEWDYYVKRFNMSYKTEGITCRTELKCVYAPDKCGDVDVVASLSLLGYVIRPDVANGSKNLTYNLQVSDTDLRSLYGTWPDHGILSLAKIRDAYTSLTTFRSFWNLDEELLKPIIMSAGGKPSVMLKSYVRPTTHWKFFLSGSEVSFSNIHTSKNIFQQSQYFSGIYTLLKSHGKNSSITRVSFEHVIFLLQTLTFS